MLSGFPAYLLDPNERLNELSLPGRCPLCNGRAAVPRDLKLLFSAELVPIENEPTKRNLCRTISISFSNLGA